MHFKRIRRISPSWVYQMNFKSQKCIPRAGTVVNKWCHEHAQYVIQTSLHAISFPEFALPCPAERALSLTKRIAASGNEIGLHVEHVLESKFVSLDGSTCVILAEGVYNFVTRGSQAECDFALVKNLSFYRFGIRSCLATNDKQTLKDAIQHDVIVHFGFLGNIAD